MILKPMILKPLILKQNMDDPWQVTTWEGNRREQLERAAQASAKERYEWLVQTFELLEKTLPLRGKHPLEGDL